MRTCKCCNREIKSNEGHYTPGPHMFPLHRYSKDAPVCNHCFYSHQDEWNVAHRVEMKRLMAINAAQLAQIDNDDPVIMLGVKEVANRKKMSVRSVQLVSDQIPGVQRNSTGIQIPEYSLLLPPLSEMPRKPGRKGGAK